MLLILFFFGYTVKGIVFAGAAIIKVNQTEENGDNQDRTFAGFTIGAGLLGTVKKDFQLGVVLGFDKVSHGSQYDHNGKPWIAVALGFSFSN